MRIRLEFKKEDCWIGMFWRKQYSNIGTWIDIWICLIPMIPIHITYLKSLKQND